MKTNTIVLHAFWCISRKRSQEWTGLGSRAWWKARINYLTRAMVFAGAAPNKGVRRC